MYWPDSGAVLPGNIEKSVRLEGEETDWELAPIPSKARRRKSEVLKIGGIIFDVTPRPMSTSLRNIGSLIVAGISILFSDHFPFCFRGPRPVAEGEVHRGTRITGRWSRS